MVIIRSKSCLWAARPHAVVPLSPGCVLLPVPVPSCEKTHRSGLVGMCDSSYQLDPSFPWPRDCG